MFAYVENNGGSTTKKMGPPNEELSLEAIRDAVSSTATLKPELGARMDRVESRSQPSWRTLASLADILLEATRAAGGRASHSGIQAP